MQKTNFIKFTGQFYKIGKKKGQNFTNFAKFTEQFYKIGKFLEK